MQVLSRVILGIVYLPLELASSLAVHYTCSTRRLVRGLHKGRALFNELCTL